MKYIYTLLVLLVVLTSCSRWKYGREIKWKEPNHYSGKSKAAEMKDERTTATVHKDIRDPENVEPDTENSRFSGLDETQEEADVEHVDAESREQEETTILVRDFEDSTQKASPEMVRIAFEAEEQGRKSRNLGIAGLIFTATYVLAFVGLILSIIGLAKGINSLRSRYNTPEGVKMARIGIITSGILIGIYAVVTITLITALILLLL